MKALPFTNGHGSSTALLRALAAAVLGLGALSSTAAEKIPVANEGGIRDAWMLPPGLKLAIPGVPAAYSANAAETCVVIGYLIRPDGSTSDFALLKAWSASEPQRDRDEYWGAYANAAAAALAQWRFQPRPEVGAPVPVYTAATFVFSTTAPLELRKRCALPSLAERLVELGHDETARRRMRGIFDRLDIDPSLEERYRDYQRARVSEDKPRPQPRSPAPPANH